MSLILLNILKYREEGVNRAENWASRWWRRLGREGRQMESNTFFWLVCWLEKVDNLNFWKIFFDKTWAENWLIRIVKFHSIMKFLANIR